MEFAQVHYAGWLIKLCAWGWLFYQGRRNQIIRKYELVFAYAAVAALFSTLLLGVGSIVGLASPVYAHLYFWAEISGLVFTISILLKLYWLFDEVRWDRDWHLLLVPVLLCAIELLQPRDAWVYFRLIYCVYSIAIYFGLCALVRRIFSQRVILGWNMSLVLLAFTVPGVFHALAFATFLHEGNAFAIQVWNQATAISSWVILAVGMTEYSPPRLVEEVELAEQLEFRVVRVRMWESIKLLWRLLRS